jgi:hypothetical protein
MGKSFGVFFQKEALPDSFGASRNGVKYIFLARCLIFFFHAGYKICMVAYQI